MESRISPRQAIHGWLAQNESIGREFGDVQRDRLSTVGNVLQSTSELTYHRQNRKKHAEERQYQDLRLPDHGSSMPSK